MKFPFLKILATALIVIQSSTLAQAQFGFGGSSGETSTISGTGVSIIKRPPEILRLQIELSAKAKTLKESLAKLNSQRDAAIAHLTKLGADPDTLKSGESRINTTVSNRQRQMEMMVRQRMRQGGKKSKKAPEKLVTVTTALVAEWKLKSKGNEDLLLEAQAIQDKVRAAELTKSSDEQTAEDEETAEEMDASMDMYEDGQLKPGEPLFIFVTKVSKGELADALVAAFGNAKANAEQLSTAAGSELGPLRGLTTSQSSPEAFFASTYGNFGNDPVRQHLMQMRSQRAQLGEDLFKEAIGVQPSEVVLPITVYASFTLQAKPK